MLTAWYAIRSLVFYAGYALIVIQQSLGSLLAWPLLPYEWFRRYMLSGCHLAVWWARVSCGIRYEVIGIENIPSTPCVVLSKHQSAWETLFLQTWLQPATTVAKRELLRIPFFGWGMALMKPIAINRARPAQALKQVIHQGIARLREGYRVIIFPEGTRTLPGEQREYSAGGAMLAVKAQVPVLPVALNSGDCWPRGTLIKRPGVIRVVFGPLIKPDGLNAKALTERARAWIESAAGPRQGSAE
ncbi:MAG: lysophospholipid acyltransferase family protein [Pseudomonadota bacterium]